MTYRSRTGRLTPEELVSRCCGLCRCECTAGDERPAPTVVYRPGRARPPIVATMIAPPSTGPGRRRRRPRLSRVLARWTR